MVSTQWEYFKDQMYHINIHWTRTVCSLLAVNFLLLSHHTYHFQTQKPKVIADYSFSLVVHKRLFLWKFFALIICLLFILFPLKYRWQCQESSAGLSVNKAGPLCSCLLGELYALAWKQSHQRKLWDCFVSCYSPIAVWRTAQTQERVYGKFQVERWEPKPRQWPWRCIRGGPWDLWEIQEILRRADLQHSRSPLMWEGKVDTDVDDMN